MLASVLRLLSPPSFPEYVRLDGLLLCPMGRTSSSSFPFYLQLWEKPNAKLWAAPPRSSPGWGAQVSCGWTARVLGWTWKSVSGPWEVCSLNFTLIAASWETMSENHKTKSDPDFSLVNTIWWESWEVFSWCCNNSLFRGIISESSRWELDSKSTAARREPVSRESCE